MEFFVLPVSVHGRPFLVRGRYYTSTVESWSTIHAFPESEGFQPVRFFTMITTTITRSRNANLVHIGDSTHHQDQSM